MIEKTAISYSKYSFPSTFEKMAEIIFFRKPIPNSNQKVTVIKILPQSEPTKISNQNEEEDVKCPLCSKCFNFKFLLGLHLKQVTKRSI